MSFCWVKRLGYKMCNASFITVCDKSVRVIALTSQMTRNDAKLKTSSQWSDHEFLTCCSESTITQRCKLMASRSGVGKNCSVKTQSIRSYITNINLWWMKVKHLQRSSYQTIDAKGKRLHQKLTKHSKPSGSHVPQWHFLLISEDVIADTTMVRHQLLIFWAIHSDRCFVYSLLQRKTNQDMPWSRSPLQYRESLGLAA